MVKWAVRAGVVAWIGVASMALSGGALAQSGAAVDPKAMELFKEGKALMDKGDYGAACPKLEESLRVQRGVGTLYNLAECYERLGKTASAYSYFSDVATAAEVAGQDARAKAARERAMALQPKLSKLRIVVRPDAEAQDVAVQRDGVALSRVLWDKEVPVDPGAHTVTAQAPGKAVFTKTVEVTGPGQVVTVEVPALDAAPPSAKGSAGFDGRAPFAQAPPEKRSIIPAVVLGGAAFVTIGAGLGMFLASNGVISDGEAIRDQIVAERGTCRAESGAVHSLCGELDAKKSTIKTLDGLAFGAGVTGVLVLGGMIVYLALPSPTGRPAASAVRVRLAPAAGPGGGGVMASGSF